MSDRNENLHRRAEKARQELDRQRARRSREETPLVADRPDGSSYGTGWDGALVTLAAFGTGLLIACALIGGLPT